MATKVFAFYQIVIFFFVALLCTQSHARLIDARISNNVETLIAINDCTKSLNIQVTTRDKVVSLVGVTHNTTMGYKLIEITASTTGVRDIDTQDLTIEYGQPLPADLVLAAMVKGRLIQHHVSRYFTNYCWPATYVRVYACKGIVTLVGWVPCRSHLYKVPRFVRTIPGVKGVVSQLYAY